MFNPDASVVSVPIGHGAQCHVIDNALVDPDAMVDWAAAQAFASSRAHAYPGPVVAVPADVTQRMADHFALHARPRLGARRTLDALVRLSMVTTPPAELVPCQWQCHRDRLGVAPPGLMIAASVLYLFRDPALGGTSFYAPRQAQPQTDRMIDDSLALDASTFGARYGLAPGYMTDGNAWFERTATVPAAWNRLIYYSGEIFHSGHIAHPDRLDTDPRRGRLTLNGFFTCRLNAS
ncbi:MAG TPA: DUF6445 family protein [Burkholderiaceae bacterium]|nr:DUF6445 family protein [Burkholderiaceae bacterium]